MTNRRDLLQMGLGAGMMAGLGWPGAALAEKGLTPLAAFSQNNFNVANAKALARADRIAIPTYRFGMVLRSGIGAMGNSGAVSMDLVADLVGMDVTMMRGIAHQMFSDFVSQLRATGRTLIGWNEIEGAAAAKKFTVSRDPFVKKPFADARTIAVVTPEYLPLINGHFDAPLSDQSPLALGNWRAINALSAELKALVLMPRIVFDFAALTGSGYRTYGSASSVGIQPGLYLVPLLTTFGFFHAKIALAGDGGHLKLEDRIAVGQAGELIKTGSMNNRAAIDEWNAYARSNMWWTQPNMAAPDRPTQAYDFSSYQYRVDPAQLTAACLDGARTAHAIFMGAINANRPG
jgi:hypothetical protein